MKKLKSVFIVLLLFQLGYSQGISQSIQVSQGWNLLSLPLAATDSLKSTLFPSAVSSAFTFTDGYQVKDTIQNGPGFWLKFESAETVYMTGDSVLADTIGMNNGWNIIGAISIPITINAMNSEPSGMITSQFYGYSQTEGRYVQTDTLQPGNGYWVKTAKSGILILSPDLGTEPPQEPTLLFPANGATGADTSLTITWMRSLRAASYTLQLSTDSSFSSFVYHQSGLAGISQQIIGLDNYTKYYWRVNATNGNGTSGWSGIWSFTTLWRCGSAIDYSGKSYNTVPIGDQCWLRENLDVGTMIFGSDTAKNNGIIEKYCYGDVPSNCDIYGGLYQWDEAMQYSANEGAQGVCPAGWHIATYAEYQALVSAVGDDGNALKEVGQGSGSGAGTNTSGFSALLSGVRSDNGSFYSLETYAYFWRSTGSGTDYAYNLNLNYYDGKVGTINIAGKANGFSLRCMKD